MLAALVSKSPASPASWPGTAATRRRRGSRPATSRWRSPGVSPGARHNAGRDDERPRVTRLAARQPGGAGSAEARESREKGAPLARTKHVWLGREASPAGGGPRGGARRRGAPRDRPRPRDGGRRGRPATAGPGTTRGRGRAPCAAGSRARTFPRRGRSPGPCGSTGPRSRTTSTTGPPTPSPGERARQSSRPRGRHEGSATWSTSRPSSTQD